MENDPTTEAREVGGKECTLYKAVFDHANDAIFLMEKGTFVECNWKTLSIFGCSQKEEILGKTPFDFSPEIQPDGENSVEKGRKYIKKALAGEPQRFEWVHTKLNGEHFFAEVTLNRVDVGCEIPKILAVVRDISPRKGLERQLTHAQRMEAVGMLAAGMAHDFNNMLGAIMGNLNLISLVAEEGGSLKEIAEYAANAEKVVSQAAQITKRLLAFTRQTPINVKNLDPVPVVDGTVEMMKRTLDRRISIELSIGEGIWKVKADESELQQILINLCINAKDTLMDRIEGDCFHLSNLRDDPPTITVEVRNEEVSEEYVRRYPFARTGRFVSFSVKDNGCGMEEKTLSRIFDPFFTTKGIGKGTGLGLAMVYGLVKQHKGWIIANSKVGVGTTFQFYIPAAEEVKDMVSERDKVNSEGSSIKNRRLTVLLADDEKVVADVCKTMLEHLGHRVVVAEDGEEAVELYRREKPDLVFLDLTMPKLSGEEVLRLILQHDPNPRVIISSGHPMNSSSERLLRMGALLYLQKPYRIKEVKEAIEKAMGG